MDVIPPDRVSLILDSGYTQMPNDREDVEDLARDVFAAIKECDQPIIELAFMLIYQTDDVLSSIAVFMDVDSYGKPTVRLIVDLAREIYAKQVEEDNYATLDAARRRMLS